jgi:hypothetical protein
LTDTVDTGFEAVLAGEMWAPPEPPMAATSSDPESQHNPIELVTATVNPSGLTHAGVQAAKALVALPDLTPADLAKLAREIAMDIKDRHVILADYKLSETQYEFLEANNEFYKAALHAACLDWQAPLSTQERIRVEAAAILEDSLLGLGARMRNKAEGLPGVIEAAKLFAKVAGVGEREAGASAPGERFTINIDLGGDQKITVQTAPAPEAAAKSAVLHAIRQDGEG